MAKNEEKYITLKEAAELSGYSSDYVGQLIRRGKISGKKVYSNVAWVTTEKALMDYADSLKNGDQGLGSKIVEKSTQARRLMLINADPFKIYRFLTYFGMISSVLLFLLVFYIFSTALDNKIEKRALQSANLEEVMKMTK